jgi:ABC-type dipeptide/oligopeptide/nickel transport system ATPase component
MAAMIEGAPRPLLDVRDLTTVFATPGGPFKALDSVSFELAKGETLGLVGPSGSGKSLTALSVLRLVQPPGRIVSGQVVFEGRDLLSLPDAEMCRVRGRQLALVFQDPAAALNPVFTVGDQVAETLRAHGLADRASARDRVAQLLQMVRIPDPARRARDYPHQLSGGLRQRVAIALALACEPILVIADEPTTALDATIQGEILELLEELRSRLGLSLLLIAHDLQVVAGMAPRVAVMDRGRIVETGRTADILSAPSHPVTRALVDAVPGGIGATW